EEYRSQFDDHPAFALHYLSMFRSVEEPEHLVHTLLSKDPENNLSLYCALTVMLRNDTIHPDINDLLFESVSRDIGNDYYFEIQDMGMKFATDYLGMTRVEALKYMDNSHISAVPPLDLKEYLKQRIAESQESGDAD